LRRSIAILGIDAALRLHAGAHGGDRRRQHRERLADRRPAARIDRARRELWRCNAPTSAHIALENFFLDYGKQEPGGRANSSVWCVSRSSGRMSASAAQDLQTLRLGHFRVMGAFKLRLDVRRIAGARIRLRAECAIPSGRA